MWDMEGLFVSLSLLVVMSSTLPVIYLSVKSVVGRSFVEEVVDADADDEKQRALREEIIVLHLCDDPCRTAANGLKAAIFIFLRALPQAPAVPHFNVTGQIIFFFPRV